jgi:hypothetical protein
LKFRTHVIDTGSPWVELNSILAAGSAQQETVHDIAESKAHKFALILHRRALHHCVVAVQRD